MFFIAGLQLQGRPQPRSRLNIRHAESVYQAEDGCDLRPLSDFKAFGDVLSLFLVRPKRHGPTNLNFIESQTEQVGWNRKSFGGPTVNCRDLNERSPVHT